MSWSQNRYTEAAEFAAQAHRGQTVPGTNLPYVMHPVLAAMEVIAALAVEEGRDGNLALQCALLHDAIEDTDVTYDQLEKTFGTPVADGVLALSKDERLPKDLQMNDSLERIQQQPYEVWMVKLADRISNLHSPPPYWSQERIKAYREEAVLIRDTLGEASPFLVARMNQKIEEYG